MNIGIDALQFDIPKIFLPIDVLAEARGIEPAKLQFGLGLEKMSFPDAHQDSVVFAANALRKLLVQEKLNPKDFHRIYVATESSVDGSKPIASYLLSLMEQNLYQENSLNHVDVVDMYFACISGVDALQNSIDFVKANPNKKAIVVCTDIAKYDWESSGEYTQGAGAVAMLISANPSIIEFDGEFSVSTQGVFDFFKPRRIFKKSELNIPVSEDYFGIRESEIEIYKDQPVFDGQYSNQCYLERTSQAYFEFEKYKNISDQLYSNWNTICMHLPYCYQARRIFTEIFVEDTPSLKQEKLIQTDVKEYIKSVSKSEEYKNLVSDKIQPTEWASGKIGNMYTASIFMGMLSALCLKAENGEDLANQKFGFIAYGSGSKAKCFEGTIMPNWKEKISKISLKENIENAQAINMETYKNLYDLTQENSVVTPSKEFILDSIEEKIPELKGARYYLWVD